jgi:hypothetical protein
MSRPSYSITDIDTDVPVIEWDDFLEQFASTTGWLQGEHIGMVGPTNCGKTTLAYNILPIRQYVTALVTKPTSATADRFYKQEGFKLYRKWPVREAPHESPKRLLWPPLKNVRTDLYNQYQVITQATEQMFVQGGWCIYWDELKYLINKLAQRHMFDMMLLQGRELGLSIVGATQRPVWVPVEVFDQSTHLFFWQERDQRNLSRISGISSMDTGLIRETVVGLEPHQFLYLNTRTGEMQRSITPTPKGGN